MTFSKMPTFYLPLVAQTGSHTFYSCVYNAYDSCQSRIYVGGWCKWHCTNDTETTLHFLCYLCLFPICGEGGDDDTLPPWGEATLPPPGLSVHLLFTCCYYFDISSVTAWKQNPQRETSWGATHWRGTIVSLRPGQAAAVQTIRRSEATVSIL